MLVSRIRITNIHPVVRVPSRVVNDLELSLASGLYEFLLPSSYLKEFGRTVDNKEFFVTKQE